MSELSLLAVLCRVSRCPDVDRGLRNRVGEGLLLLIEVLLWEGSEFRGELGLIRVSDGLALLV